MNLDFVRTHYRPPSLGFMKAIKENNEYEESSNQTPIPKVFEKDSDESYHGEDQQRSNKKK